MGLPVTRYTHLDAGAPQIVNATPSEWINILKKVLIEGYGTKAPLGWTLAFEDAGTFQAAFRNTTTDGGSGGYFQIGSVTGANTTVAGMVVTAAAGMTGINSFVRKQYSRRFGLSSAVRGWEIIGTARGFYLIQHLTSHLNYYISSGNVCYFIGDYQSVYDNDPARFVLVTGRASASDANTTAINDHIGGADSLYAQVYALDGSNISNWCKATSVSVIQNGYTTNESAELLGINHVLSQLVLCVNTAASNSSTIQPQSRGIVPGLLFSTFSGYASEQWPKFLTFNGKNHVGVRGSFALYAWINTEEWYV